MGIGALHFDAAKGIQVFCIGKRHAGNPGAMPAGVYADNKFPFIAITVKFPVELGHCLPRFRIAPERVEHGKAFGQSSCILQLLIKFNYFLGYCSQSVSLQIFQIQLLPSAIPFFCN